MSAESESRGVLKALKAELGRSACASKARILSSFFKTGKGEYAEGDIFLGVAVPKTRRIAEKYAARLSVPQTAVLLRSPLHEERLAALLILKEKFERGDAGLRAAVFRLYLANTRFINNWDLVDVSSEHIVGAWLERRSRRPLLRLIGSDLVWERRIALLATFRFIKAGESGPTLELVEKVLDDKHDLIHKAAGWMLREVGKRCSMSALKGFLKANYERLPRTALRCAIERFPEKERQAWLRSRVRA